ncbi:MAG: pilus assembly protein FimV [Gammaproteobacteria bacterium]|jgi:pilus assembly protein FimV
MGVYKILFKLLMFSFLGFYTVSGYSLALSEAELKSHLNQTLDIRIELKTDDTADIDDLKVELTQSVENYTSHYQLKYEVLKSGGVNILKITSSEVVREPIVEFTLDIGWSDGQVVRGYSFLIDPPGN